MSGGDVHVVYDDAESPVNSRPQKPRNRKKAKQALPMVAPGTTVEPVLMVSSNQDPDYSYQSYEPAPAAVVAEPARASRKTSGGPKRPQNEKQRAWTCFLRLYRLDHPTMSFADSSKTAAEEWKLMHEEEKAEYSFRTKSREGE